MKNKKSLCIFKMIRLLLLLKLDVNEKAPLTKLP